MPPPALADAEIHELQALLDSLPEPLEPLDASAVDGWLAAVVLHRPAMPEDVWMRYVCDVDGRGLPPAVDATRLHELVRRRHAQLEAAVATRQWFDPIVFEPDDAHANPSQLVVGWVAGFAAALERFPSLLGAVGDAAHEPLALLYRHLDAEDLGLPDALLAEIDALEPPADATEAVEELVRATLLLADLTRPTVQPPARGTRRGRGKPRR